jgi:hypothetical protein
MTVRNGPGMITLAIAVGTGAVTKIDGGSAFSPA